MKTIKRILLLVLLLQTTCQILPTETAGDQAQILGATLWQNTKDNLSYAGSQALTGIEKAGRYCGSRALEAAKATGNFALKQAQERPFLATGIAVTAALGIYFRKGIQHKVSIVNKAIKNNPYKSIFAGVAMTSTLHLLFNEEIKTGLKTAGSYLTDKISSYLPAQTNS